MTDTPNASESAAMLALMARMAMALGDAAGIGPDGRLYIQSSQGEYLNWPVPRDQEHLFAALPKFPNPLRIEPLTQARQIDAINASYAVPSGWMEVCAARLKQLRKGVTDSYSHMLAVDVWREFVRRYLPAPAEAAELWEPADREMGEWIMKYASLVRDDAQRRQSDIDDEAPGEVGRSAALQPQYLRSTPEQAFEADQRYLAELAKDRPPIPPNVISLDADDADDEDIDLPSKAR